MVRLSDRQRFDWLRLARTEGVGPLTFRSLVNRFGGASAALEALPGLSARAKRPLLPPTEREIEAELREAERLGARLLGYGEADYPALLREIDAPPPVIALRGSLACLEKPTIGIVGSRNASALGRKIAGRFAADLAAAGYIIVSGLARGIDAEAHRASLATGTIAVLAGGLDRPYPPEHVDLMEEIVGSGLVISERPFGLAPRGRDFPRRNRVISGLSRGIIVVEAARRSGSLITARFANEQGREVFAVPGSPFDPRAEGPNDLIRDGAMLVGNARDVIAALEPRDGLPSRLPGLFSEPLEDDEGLFEEWAEGADAFGENSHLGFGQAPAPPQDRRAALLGALSASPIEVDALTRQLGLSLADLQDLLFELELEGLLQRHPGNRVSRAFFDQAKTG
ncbi:MAG: DNA-protecting protein DprA [Methylobacterium sp.]|nr:DNA-protecting protein DprA [Methylobacterium sp.]MCA3612590.1 DNA-protecting protein DprA [Methylobacterium sp.]